LSDEETMEVSNPIKGMKWLLGKWEGGISIEETNYESVISFHMYGEEFIFFEVNTLRNRVPKPIEKGFFYFDKLEETIKSTSYYWENFIETSTWNVTSKKNKIIMQSSFIQGTNLPPNMQFAKEIFYDQLKKSLFYSIKLGKTEKRYFLANYTKKHKKY